MRRSLAAALCLVVAACGGGSDSGTGPSDPTVTLTAPADGAVVQGTVNFQATAANADRVRFLVDGLEIAADAEAPFAASWNSASVANGQHAVKAVAEGSGGSAEDAITLAVANPGGPEIAVQIAPSAATVETARTQQFTATVSNTTNQAVTWSVEGGTAFGSVSPVGLYTAPSSLPNPARATVRATSAADPARSATAMVTLVAPGGVSQELATTLREAFTAGTDASLAADEAVKSAAALVFTASIANGGTLTLTGTLTENAQAPGGFTWAASPGDRMVVLFTSGARAEIVFAAFDGFLGGDADDFVDFHSNLDFTVVVAGLVDLRIRSASGNPASPRGGPAAAPSGVTVFERRITGTYRFQGTDLTVDLTNTGTRDADIDGSGIDYLSEESTRGTLTSPRGQVQVDSTFRYRLVKFDNFAENVTRGEAGSVTFQGDTYRFVDAVVRKAYLNAKVSDAEFWLAQGTLTRNGQPIASVRFDGPIVEGADFPGPGAELAFAGGGTAPLAGSGPRDPMKATGRAAPGIRPLGAAGIAAGMAGGIRPVDPCGRRVL